MANKSSSSSLKTTERISVTGFLPMLRYIGSVKRNFETNEEYVAFYGVPYARTPVKLERYKAPETMQVDINFSRPNQVYEANVINKKCSVQPWNGGIRGSVDCLYMNIYLPKRPASIKERLPVLVYFHGGGFTFGNHHPDNYTPDSIIQHGVIFITVGYRLGLHGFFNAHNEICPGNAGLKDQVKALEWIKANIEYFKGNPKNVTISGSSAGATCVNLHLISPLSKGLFHKAIVQSGGIYTQWGYRGHRRKTKEVLMADLECQSLIFAEEDADRLHIRAHEVLLADRELRHPYSLSPFFGPTTETIKEGAFIPDTIQEMMLKAEVSPKISILAGITHNEGIQQFAIHRPNDFAEWISSPYRFLRFLMDTFRWNPATAVERMDQIRDRYCPDVENLSTIEKKRCFAKTSGEHPLPIVPFEREIFLLVKDVECDQTVMTISGIQFKFGPKKTLHENLYVYEFVHFSEMSCVSRENLMTTFPCAATHMDELKYLYCPQSTRQRLKKKMEAGLEISPDIRQVTNHMCSLWANFCKNDVPSSDFAPNVKWRPHTEEDPCYLRISNSLELKEGVALCKDDWDWLNSVVDDQPVVQSRPPTP